MLKAERLFGDRLTAGPAFSKSQRVLSFLKEDMAGEAHELADKIQKFGLRYHYALSDEERDLIDRLVVLLREVTP